MVGRKEGSTDGFLEGLAAIGFRVGAAVGKLIENTALTPPPPYM
jgi:hypothetical protein